MLINHNHKTHQLQLGRLLFCILIQRYDNSPGAKNGGIAHNYVYVFV